MKTSLDVVIPIYNEEEDLNSNINLLKDFLTKFDDVWHWKILIVDNGSTDNSEMIGLQLEADFPHKIKYKRMNLRGRGRALSEAWTQSPADIVCYMDLDLSTNLTHFETLVSAIDKKRYHVAIGSRMMKDSQVLNRTLFRTLLSQGYSFLIKIMFSPDFMDAQCGFKAMRSSLAKKVVPTVKDTGFFWDTELLLASSAAGLKILEIPVLWRDDPNSRVRIFHTIISDLRGLLRMRLGGAQIEARKILQDVKNFNEDDL